MKTVFFHKLRCFSPVLVSLCFVFLIVNTSCEELTNEEDPGPNIVAGLKEALRIGTDSTVSVLNVTNGYYDNPVHDGLRILLPEEVQEVESTLRTIPGVSPLVDQLIVEMNRAAEDAAEEAKPIFWNAITGMSFSDAMGILQGDSTAATMYMEDVTRPTLTDTYHPRIQNSMEKVGVQTTWENISSEYNTYVRFIPNSDTLPTDISMHITDRALDGLFVVLATEEARIRRDPVARVTDLLKEVFSLQD